MKVIEFLKIEGHEGFRLETIFKTLGCCDSNVTRRFYNEIWIILKRFGLPSHEILTEAKRLLSKYYYYEYLKALDALNAIEQGRYVCSDERKEFEANELEEIRDSKINQTKTKQYIKAMARKEFLRIRTNYGKSLMDSKTIREALYHQNPARTKIRLDFFLHPPLSEDFIPKKYPKYLKKSMVSSLYPLTDEQPTFDKYFKLFSDKSKRLESINDFMKYNYVKELSVKKLLLEFLKHFFICFEESVKSGQHLFDESEKLIQLSEEIMVENSATEFLFLEILEMAEYFVPLISLNKNKTPEMNFVNRSVVKKINNEKVFGELLKAA